MLVPANIRVSQRAKTGFLVGLLVLFLVGCQESAERSNLPTEGSASALTRIPVEGVMVGDETGDEREFKGALTVTNLAYEEGLVVSGLLTGSRPDSEVGGSFENVPATLSAASGPRAEGGADAATDTEVEPPTCGIYLELGPVALSGDVGSLQISLVTVKLDLDASPGSLGALLCSLARFLDARADVPDGLVARINALLDHADF